MYSKNGKTGLILFVLAALILITLSCDKLLPEREVNNPLDPTNPNIPVQDSIGVLEVDGTIWVGQPARMYIRFSEVFGSASAKLQALYQINSDANVSDTLISPLQQILETDTLLAAMLELHHNKTGGDFSLRAFWIDNFDNSDSSAALPATIDTRAPWITSDAREVWPNPMERARWALGVEHTITLVALDGYSQSSPKMPALYPGVGVDADLAYLVFLDDEDRELSELRFREIELGNWLENLAVPGDLLEDSADFIAFELDFSVLSDMTEILSQTENVMIRVGDILGNFREDKYVPIFDLDRASISLQGDGIESGTAFSDTLAFHVEITDDDAVSDNIKYLSAINIYASTEYNDSIYYFSYDPIHPILGDTTLISFNDNLNRYELNFDVFWRWHHVTDLGEGTHDMTITVEVVDVAGDTTISSPILQFENLMQGLDGLEDLIDFGTVKIGEVYRDTITITNLSTFEVRIENVRSSEPSVLNLDFTDPVILDDDDSLEVPVSFTPTEEDPEFTAILNVDWSDPNEENGLRTIFTERTTGFFTALVDNPDLVVETGDLDWEWVGFSDSTQIDSFILSNTGEVDLEISNVSSSNPGVFRLEDANVPYTIAPDGTWDIQVTFLPDHAANFVADLSIESDDPDGVHVESGFFRGIGEPMTYTLEPALMNMGIITSDATSHDTIIIANTSHIEIEFDTVYSNTTEFFIDNEFPEDLRLDPLIDGDDPDYIELPVEFHSPDDGAYIGDLIVQWDDFPLMTGGSNGDNSLFNAKPRSSARNTKITATRKSDNRKLSISNSKRTDRKRRGPAIQKQSRDGINRLSGQQRKQRPTALEMIREAGGINDGFELDETGMDTHTNYFTGIVGSPEVVFHPTLVNFEVIEVNATGLDSFEIENQSNNILNVDSILFDDPHFVLTGEYDFELQPNTSQVCYVEFTPTEPITYRGTIQLILDNPPDTTEEIPYLSGIGGESRMELSPTLLSFGVVDVGATDTIRFVIQNEGRWPLQVNSFDVEVDTSVVDTNGWAANGLFIADIFDREVIAMPQIIGVDEESNSIYVAFVPPRDTDFAAQLIIDSNDPASPHTLDFFTGTGARGHYRFDPTILSYGVVERGIESPELTFWMYNSGLDLLEVGGMSSDDGLGIFTITSEHVDPFEIPANDSTQVSATFTPPGAHDYTANLEFDEVSIPFFSGTGGFPRIGLTPASYNYGVVAIHENETHTFRITNNGLTNLVLDDITSNDPVLLEVDWAGEETVLPQAFFDFDATFSPLVRGVHNFDLIISYNTFEELTVDDYFSGFGGSGLINLSPGLLGFGLQSANTFRIETFTIINEGETDLDITGFAISDNDEDNIIFDFVGDPGTPTIPSEGSVDIDIIFSPANPVDYTGTVTISSDHPGVEEIELNLTGTGSSARMRLSPLQLSYGSVEVDEDSIRTFVIYNDGEQVDLEIIEILTGDPDIFVIVDPDIEDIPPGESSDPIEVRFQPDDDRQYVENLFINTNANDIDIPFFTGTGGIPVIGLEPTMLDFGLVAFRFGNNRTLSFDIANNGAVEVTLDSLVSNHVSFVPNDNAFPIDMDAGESREINATFTPIELGVHQATLTIYSEDLDDPYVVNYFTGLGGIGEISVTPGNLNYGIIELREDDTDYFRIHNRGAVDVSILNFASSNPDIFQIVGYDFPIDIAADDSFRVNVTFEPEDAENYFGHLEISSDWGDETYQNFFTGTGGEPHIDLRPALINFGSVEVGDDETRNFELWNDGTYELVVDNMTTGHDDFTITTVTEFTLPVGEYRTIFVDFEPSLPQLYAVDLTIDVVSQTYDDYTVEFLYGSGAEAIADVDPHVVDFGEVVVGESSTESFEVQNDGTVALTVTAITLNNEVYEVLTATPFTVQPEATYQVNVEFTPPFSGTYLADLSIQSNDPDSPLEILEFCTGLGWASEIEIDPEDGVLDYGNVDIDSTEEMTFDVINHGNATLSVTSIVISGDDPDYFTVDGPTSFDITAGGTNTVTIEFNPLDPVDYFADLTINCDDPNNPTIEFDDNLIGTGWGPVIVIDPDSDIPYGNVLVDRDSTRSFDIENNGNEDFTVTDVYSSEGVFEVVNGTEFTLVAGGDPRTVNITFSPLARQFHSGELTIASDEIDDLVYDNYFSGTGRQPVISLDPEQEVNFGDVLVDRDSTMEFDIVNDGDWTYSVTNITSSEGAFTITSDTEFSLPAHNSETIEVMFSPTATQDYAGTLTIESDEIADEITVDFFVGTGRQPDITILPDPQLDYGDVLVDRDSSRSFTITNQGDWDLTITDISSFDGAYAITSDTAIVVESDGGRQTVHVLFSPLVAREFPSTLTVVSDEIADIVMDDFFTGFGRIPEISLDPDPFLSFGDVLVDRDSTSSFVITNGGDWDFNVTDITSSENGYTILGETDFTVTADGGEHEVSVRFSPTVQQEYLGILTIQSIEIADIVIGDDEGEDEYFFGTGRIPVISLDPDVVLPFDVVLVDTDSTLSFDVENTGDWDFTVSDITFTNDAFTIVPSSDSAFIVGALETFTVDVMFSPLASQDYTGSMTIISDEIADIDRVDYFEGEGRQPVISLDPVDALAFDIVLVGVDSTVSFDIINDGNANYTVTDVTSSEGVFTVTNGTSFTVTPNDTHTVNIEFSPVAATDYLGTLTIESVEIVDIVETDYFTGTGTQPDISLDPVSELAFDSVLVDTDSTLSFDITNGGDANFTVEDINSSEGAFTFESDTAFVVGPGETVTVDVMFSPTVRQVYAGDLTIVSVEIDDIVMDDYFTGDGRQPVISFDPVDLAFGEELVDFDHDLSFDIVNDGNANLTVTSITSDEGTFTITNGTDFTVSPYTSHTVDIRFSPLASQAYSGTLTIVSTEIADIVEADYFTGTGIQPVIALDPVDEVSFGSVLVSTNGIATFDINNSGDADLTVTDVTSSDDAFTITSGTAFTVTAGGSEEVTVWFSPTAAQAYTGTLTIVSDEIDDIVEADYFTGTGIEPVITLDPLNEVDFGDVLVDFNGNATFDIDNTGDADFTVYDVASSDGAFSVTNGTVFTVDANSSRTVNVRFSPTAAGDYTGTLTITSEEIDDIVEVDYFVGTGIEPVITLNPLNELAFGDELVDFSNTLSFDIDNNGDADYTVTSVTSSEGVFTITNGTAFVVSAGGSHTVDVLFSPTVAQDYTGTLTIVGDELVDDIVETDYFTGTGVQPEITLDPLLVDGGLAFGYVLINTESDVSTFDIVNGGDADLTITDMTSSEDAFVIDYDFDVDGDITVPANTGTVTIDVTFNPTAIQDYTGTLTIVSDELVDDIVETDYFTGTGAEPVIVVDPLLVDGGLEFGGVEVDTDDELTFDIVNSGFADLTITSL
ncbi:MAG: choice-of-anchor D domain-containing protein, partial [Candidatus Electryonea clarkiae]|nr:choice-of-anchor D domain-containing protein [Candidatus Electryonea clarkiae]